LNPSVNIVLKRTFEYDQSGRYQNKDEAISIDNAITSTLMEYETDWMTISPKQIEMIITYAVGK
jgi:hypothetical protein